MRDIISDRGVDGELKSWDCFVIQRFSDCDCASGPVDGKVRRRRLEGEENAASSALVWICSVDHEHHFFHRCVLKRQTDRQTVFKITLV